MSIRSDKQIYRVLEKRLRDTTTPLTCTDLIDRPDIRREFQKEYGEDSQILTNKLSDALGLMWRKGLLIRYPAPRDSTSLAKHSYIWDTKQDTKTPTPILSPTHSVKKTGVIIKETNDGIVLDFEKFTIIIQQK